MSVTISGPMHNQAIYPWQQELWQTLSQRFMDKNLAHAYLLSGEPGIGKLTFATSFAHYLLCQNRSSGLICGNCKACSLLAAVTNPDMLFITPEDDSTIIKIDQIRALINFGQHTAHANGNRAIVLYPAEALNIAAANALLKLLEEPNPGMYFLLLSHQPGLLAATVRSRCQHIAMPIPEQQQAMDWLQHYNPDSPQQEILAALQMCNGRPFAALDALENKLSELRKTLLSELKLLLQARVLPTELARIHEKSDRIQVLSFMLQSLSSLIRYQSSTDTGYIHDKDLQDLAQLGHIEPNKGKQQSRNLLALYTTLQESLRLLKSSSNPNPLLILENSFIALQTSLKPPKNSEIS